MMKRATVLFVGLWLLIGTWSGADAQWLRADKFEMTTVGCVAVSGSVFYLGTNASSAVSYGNGTVLRSKDGGASWSSLAGKGWPGRAKTPYRNGIRVQCISVNGTTILAGTSSMGVLISKDGGLSWAEGNTGLPKNASVKALAFGGADIYAGLWDQTVYVSRDGGSSWAVAGAGLPAVLWATSVVAVDSRLFVGTYNRGIFISYDSGTSWTETNAGVPGPAGLPEVRSLVAIGPEVFALIYGLGIHRFHEKDRSWKPVNPEATSAASALTLAPGGSELFIAVSPKGVLVSKDKGASWKETAPGLNPEYQVDFLATDGSTVVAGTLAEAWRLSLAGSNADAKPAAAGDRPARDSADFQTLMANGDRAQQAEDFANAVMYYGKAIMIDPGSTSALFQRAWSYLKLGAEGYDNGLADLAKIQSLDAANTTIYYARGEIYRGKASLTQKAGNAKDADGFLAKALADYDLALKANPNSPVILLAIARALTARGDLGQALKHYGPVLEKDPYDLQVQNELAALFQDHERRGLVIDGETSARVWALAGDFYAERKRDDQAVRCYSRALDLSPADTFVYLSRSRAFSRLGDLDRALADAERYIQLYPSDGSFANRAEVFAQKRDYDKAIADMSQAIRLQKKLYNDPSPDDKPRYLYRLYWRRGDFYFLKKEWDKAIEDYRLIDEKLRPGTQKQVICLQLAEAYKNKGDAANAQKYLELYKVSGPPKK